MWTADHGACLQDVKEVTVKQPAEHPARGGWAGSGVLAWLPLASVSSAAFQPLEVRGLVPCISVSLAPGTVCSVDL